MCACCPAVTRIRLEPDAHGREKALLRAEIASLIRLVHRLKAEFEDYKVRADIARTEDAGRFMEMAVELAKAGAGHLRTADDMSRDLDAIKWQIDAIKGNHNPKDLAKLAELEALVRKLKKRLEYYETPNSRRGMPSLYNPLAKAFDREQAESCGRPKPDAALGPPMGHPGASHRLKPEKVVRYPIFECLHCGRATYAHQAKQPESKTFVEIGEDDGRVHVWQLIVCRLWCSKCHEWSRAPDAPDLKGTWFGPVMLSKMLVLYALAATDRKLSRYLESLLGTSACASALWNGRRAAARILEPFMKHLERLLTSTGWGHFDETTMRMFGRQGYLWLLTVACAAMVVARPSRGKGIFDEEFAFARQLAGVVDGYKVYEIILGEIQRCWRHVINNFKKAAIVSDDPAVRLAYHEFCSLYERVSGMDTAPEEERDSIVQRALDIAGRLPEGHPSRVEIENAAKNLVTFLMFKDMPPTNNPGESDVRRVPVAQRNVRYQLRTVEGARVFSVILSFILTCDKQGIPLDEAFVALARGADPADIFKVGQVAPNRWGGAGKPARPGRGPLDGPMPPECIAAARAGGGSGGKGAAADAAAADASIRAAAEAARAVEAAAADASIRAAAEAARAVEAAAADASIRAAAEAARAVEAAAADASIRAAAEAARAVEAAAADASIRAAAEASIRAAAEAARAVEAAAADASIRAAAEAAKAVEAAAADARIQEAVAVAIALHARQSPQAPRVMPRTASQAHWSRAAPSQAAPSIRLRADSRRSMPRLLRAPRPAPARLRHPPKPPPPSMRRCGTPQRRRRRPGNWHVPIKPSVPPPCKSDDPEVRVHGAKTTRLDLPQYQGTGVHDPSPTGV